MNYENPGESAEAEKKVVDLKYESNSATERMGYRPVYEDGTVGELEETDVRINEPNKFVALKAKLRREFKLDQE
jgi:hypothetical protein